MILGTLGARLLGNILAGKGINRAGEGVIRAGYGNKKLEKATKWIFNTALSFGKFWNAKILSKWVSI